MSRYRKLFIEEKLTLLKTLFDKILEFKKETVTMFFLSYILLDNSLIGIYYS